MYYHLIHRICMVANPHIQGLIQHFQQYKEDPAAPPPNLPTHGSPAVAWRLLVSEAARAARDVTLAPQFSLAVLSPMNSTVLPVPSLRLFGLPPQFNFTLAAHTLASPNIFSQNQQFYNHVQSLVYQSYDSTLDALVAEGPFWTYQTSPHHPVFSDDMSKQEGHALILALYPRGPPLAGSNSRPPSPSKSASPHPALLDTYRRHQFLRAISVKFTSSIIAESLSSLSPGGPPRSAGSIPLEHILFEIGELSKEDPAVEEIVRRWWSPWLLQDGDSQAITIELCRTIWGLCEGLASERPIDINTVSQVLISLVSLQKRDGADFSPESRGQM
jgi:CCR4-NOT transcription complex subunit 1